MAAKSNTFESGETSGTAITASNSADPDAFQVVTGNVVYSDAHPAHGTLGMLAQTGAAAKSFVQWPVDINSWQSVRFNFFSAYPATNHRLIQWGTPAGSCLDLEWRTDGRIRLRNAYATNMFQSIVLPASTMLRIEVDVFFAEGSGWAKLRIYNGADSMTLLDSFDSDTDLTLRGVPTYLRFGAIDDVASAALYFDDVAYQPGGGFIGPVIPPNKAPVVSAGTYKAVAFGKTATLTTTATDSDGSVASYAYSVLEGIEDADIDLDATGNVCIVSSTLPGAIVVQCAVTDDDGAVSYVDHNVEFVNRLWVGQLGWFTPRHPSIEQLPESPNAFGSSPFGDLPFGS